jgi:hypothetical protein
LTIIGLAVVASASTTILNGFRFYGGVHVVTRQFHLLNFGADELFNIAQQL